MRNIGFLAFFFLTSVGAATAESTFRFASWNIANFSHIEGVEHRPDIGTRRNATDFAVLKKYADGLDADVIALEEIGTIEAVELLFPPSRFTVIPSEQLAAAAAAGGSEDIFTAIVVRKRPDITVGLQRDLNELAVIHQADGRPVRSGTAVQLDLAGTKIWVLAVHLKSSCPDTANLAGSGDADCKTLWSQRIPLRAWIEEREANGEAFAIMGDFNRQFRRFGPADQFWQALSADGVSQPNIVAHPLSVTRRCPTRLGVGTQPIDWIMLSGTLANGYVDQSYWETRYKLADINATGGFGNNSRISDHCPIQVDVALP